MNQIQGKSGWGLNAAMGFCGFAAAACFLYGISEWNKGMHALRTPQQQQYADWGNVGSYLQGTVASLWALAGVFLFVLAYLGQQRELRLQRAQLAAQEKQLKDQLETMKKQSFEDSFFQLLNLQRELQAQVKVVTLVRNDNGLGVNPKTVHGKDCFQFIRNDMKDNYDNRTMSPRFMAEQLGNEPQPLPPEKERAIMAYTTIFSAKQQQLAHYFRNLYHIFKFVAESDMPDKRRYASLVRAQLSAYELAVLFYNCVSPYGKGFEKYVEQFGLMEHLDHQLLLNPSHADNKEFYAEGAYE
jgi:hypothetical protein